MTLSRLVSFALAAGLFLLGGCASKVPAYDYAAFQQAKPVSLLVMPPVNESPDIKATPAVWAQATRPLAEAGYYVLPVTLVDETFKQNGVSSAIEATDIPYTKLRDFFGADAAVYLRVTKYGTSYAVVASETRVEVAARIVVPSRLRATAGSRSNNATRSGRSNFAIFSATSMTVLIPILPAAPW